VITSNYYVVNELTQFKWRLLFIASRMPWTDSVARNIARIIIILARKDTILICACLTLAAVGITLIFFVLQQAWYVSINRTQVELDKIDDLTDKWKAKKIDRRYVHAYSRGFFNNWKEFLFPPAVEKHEPRDYSQEFARQQEEAERKKAKKEKAIKED
jgi:hypothetical protein